MDHDLELVIVFETWNGALVAVARALLQGAGIPFVAQGETVQDYIGAGRFPGGYNLAPGPGRFLVERRDPADAAPLPPDGPPAQGSPLRYPPARQNGEPQGPNLSQAEPTPPPGR